MHSIARDGMNQSGSGYQQIQLSRYPTKYEREKCATTMSIGSQFLSKEDFWWDNPNVSLDHNRDNLYAAHPSLRRNTTQNSQLQQPLNRLKGLAVNLGHTQTLECLHVLLGGITLMLRQPVTGITEIHCHHLPIPGHLGND